MLVHPPAIPLFRAKPYRIDEWDGTPMTDRNRLRLGPAWFRCCGLLASWLVADTAVAQPVTCGDAFRPPSLAGCGTSPSQPAAATASPEAAFLPLWSQLPNRAGWRILVSPAFPATWPPARGTPGAVNRYAFAMRIPAGLADGAVMAAPWARSLEGADGTTAVERLQPDLQPLGIQGVRPIAGVEAALARREEDVAALLLAGADRATDRLVREFTCGWIKRQGVVAAAITPRHPGFAAWLACP